MQEIRASYVPYHPRKRDAHLSRHAFLLSQCYTDDDVTTPHFPSQHHTLACREATTIERQRGIRYVTQPTTWSEVEPIRDLLPADSAQCLPKPDEGCTAEEPFVRTPEQLTRLATERLRQQYAARTRARQAATTVPLADDRASFTSTCMEQYRAHMLEERRRGHNFTSAQIFGDMTALSARLSMASAQAERLRFAQSRRDPANAKVATRVRNYTAKELSQLPDAIRQRPFFCHSTFSLSPLHIRSLVCT